jgi:hypothetical protein
LFLSVRTFPSSAPEIKNAVGQLIFGHTGISTEQISFDSPILKIGIPQEEITGLLAEIDALLTIEDGDDSFDIEVSDEEYPLQESEEKEITARSTPQDIVKMIIGSITDSGIPVQES